MKTATRESTRHKALTARALLWEAAGILEEIEDEHPDLRGTFEPVNETATRLARFAGVDPNGAPGRGR